MFADELRKAREEAGLTQQAMADRAGVTREYVSLLERGAREPSLSVFVRLCQALKLDPAEVLGEMLRRRR